MRAFITWCGCEMDIEVAVPDYKYVRNEPESEAEYLWSCEHLRSCLVMEHSIMKSSMYVHCKNYFPKMTTGAWLPQSQGSLNRWVAWLKKIQNIIIIHQPLKKLAESLVHHVYIPVHMYSSAGYYLVNSQQIDAYMNWCMLPCRKLSVTASLKLHRIVRS